MDIARSSDALSVRQAALRMAPLAASRPAWAAPPTQGGQQLGAIKFGENAEGRLQPEHVMHHDILKYFWISV